jgi:hypothetical protein
MLLAFVMANPFERVEAVDVWQMQIANDQVRCRIMRQSNAAFPVIRLHQLITAQAQQFRDEIAILARILNHQNPRHTPQNATLRMPCLLRLTHKFTGV